MPDDSLTKRLLRGVLSGFAGTSVMQVVRSSSQQWLPETMPPFRQEPGPFMIEQAEAALPKETRESVPPPAETAGAQSLAVGYGMTAGGLYGLLRRKRGNMLLDGTALGLSVWAAGYLGWLPALGLTPSPDQQDPKQIAGPMLRHVVFGVATVAAYRWLSDDSSEET